MFKITNQKIEITRGDSGTIKINKLTPFNVNDKFKLSIVEKNNYNNVLFQKEFVVQEECDAFDIVIEPDDTRFCPNEPQQTFWYELEFNDKITIIGRDKKGGKEFIIYQEAVNKEV